MHTDPKQPFAEHEFHLLVDWHARLGSIAARYCQLGYLISDTKRSDVQDAVQALIGGRTKENAITAINNCLRAAEQRWKN